jgi:adenosylcobinamide kinase / adenosylcobinamide-phosphate guanylyltransferase
MELQMGLALPKSKEFDFMSRIILITGGCRSGKSQYAQKLAENYSQQRIYLATAVATDSEMKVRIQEHQKLRQPANWQTQEVPMDLKAAISNSPSAAVLLVDCITFWVNNLLYAENSLSENEIREKCLSLLTSCRSRKGTVIFVTNEVGMGIVPDNPLARQYRDLLGRCNQVLAEQADTVVLMTCGIPLFLKGSLP